MRRPSAIFENSDRPASELLGLWVVALRRQALITLLHGLQIRLEQLLQRLALSSPISDLTCLGDH